MLYSESVINTVQNIQLPNAILIDNWKVRIQAAQLSYINRHESLRRNLTRENNLIKEE